MHTILLSTFSFSKKVAKLLFKIVLIKTRSVILRFNTICPDYMRVLQLKAEIVFFLYLQYYLNNTGLLVIYAEYNDSDIAEKVHNLRLHVKTICSATIPSFIAFMNHQKRHFKI